MVQVAMGFIREAPTPEKKLSIIETLRTVTEGKVYGAISSHAFLMLMLRC